MYVCMYRLCFIAKLEINFKFIIRWKFDVYNYFIIADITLLLGNSTTQILNLPQYFFHCFLEAIATI